MTSLCNQMSKATEELILSQNNCWKKLQKLKTKNWPIHYHSPFFIKVFFYLIKFEKEIL